MYFHILLDYHKQHNKKHNGFYDTEYPNIELLIRHIKVISIELQKLHTPFKYLIHID